MTPLLKGLPGNMDQTPYWEYVLKGEMVMQYKDHKETFKAGDVYYTPPEHTGVVKAG